MKKILLSLSALTIGATPAITLLSSTEKHVITKVTSKIQKKIDESALLFKAPIITNGQKQNADVTTNWLNDQKVSDISHIDSSLSYAQFNEQTYDMNSTNKTLSTIYKQDGYKYKNDDALQEMLHGVADKGLNLLENLIDDNGLKFDGINEAFNWISYISLLTGDKLKADKFDSGILKFADKISFIKMFKNSPAPTYTQLLSEGVKTYMGLKFYALSNFNSFMSTNFGLTANDGAWNFKIEESDKTARNFFDQSSVFYKEVFVKEGDASKHSFKFSQDSLKYLFNFIYSLSYYLDAFNAPEYKPDIEKIQDQNHLFSSTKSNIDVISEVYKKDISKEDIQKGSLQGILTLLYDIIGSVNDPKSYKASRTLKILFQVDNDITDGNERLDLNTKVLKANKSKFVSVDVGEWKKNTTGSNGIFNILLASLAKGFLDNQVSGAIGSLLFLIGLSTENLGSIIAGLVSSLLTGIDMSNFFSKLSSQLGTTLKNMYGWGFGGIIGNQIKKPLEKQLTKMKFGTEDTPNKPLQDKFKEKPTDDFIDYLDKMMTKFSNIKIKDSEDQTWNLFNNLFNQIINEKGRLQSLLNVLGVSLPIDMSDKSLKDLFAINIFGTTIGDLLTNLIKGVNSMLPQIYKVFGLLGSITSDEAATKYDFFIQENNEPLLISIDKVLGYTPENGRTSDIALIWSMMKFVKSDDGKNKAIGIREKNSNNTSEEIIWGHKAWKYLLGLDMENKTYVPNSILGYLDWLLSNKLAAKLVQVPIKFARKYVENNLSGVDYNRNKKMTYWSNKELFTTELISYSEDKNQENLKYDIIYKLKKGVYATYEVSVYKEFTTNKYKISSFNRI
ncbi:hypothetical protein [Mesoplasma melaleucae]|uniref:MOLPALP family lipoprotein n=1 Tax=Mesoplasma melaleucae TaxID=81459 RepID=A0A2K8NV94_9MOLU|nr:hypothetical protein [Mesoplasma melaleucae]ATZ17765.1 hypothetical protein EMELA_v1c01830 [Mesoplasma melaleucae]